MLVMARLFHSPSTCCRGMAELFSGHRRQNTSHVSENAISRARRRLWAKHCATIRRSHRDIVSGRCVTITHDGFTMKFWYKKYGTSPPNGHSLYIALHGGGGCPPEVNDSQFEHMKVLYQPQEGIYLVPRAPTNTWDLWHQPHIDVFLDRIISNLIVLENVDPDRIFLQGYSAGGDGVYQLGPRLADRFAAAAMMAGHPNDARPEGLRNLPFTLHVGANDTPYNRNRIAAEWAARLARLQSNDPEGYVHEALIHPGLGHWMEGKDAIALPWMARHVRPSRPKRVVWVQSKVTHRRFYWLYVDDPQAGSELIVERDGSNFRVVMAKDVTRLVIRLDDNMVNLDEQVTVLYQERVIFQDVVPRSFDVLSKTLEERGDPRGMYCAEVAVRLDA